MYKSSELHLLIILAYYTVACAPQTQVNRDVHLPDWYKYNRRMCSCFSPSSTFVMAQGEPETDGDHDERSAPWKSATTADRASSTYLQHCCNDPVTYR